VDQLEQTGLPAHRLMLEHPDFSSPALSPDAVDELARLRALGVGIAVDGFGSAPIAFDRLPSGPVSTVKLSPALVRGVGSDPARAAVAAGLLGILHELRLETVAVGVEDETDWAWLRVRGCSYGQGYHLGWPVGLDELPNRLPHAG
jgi:EAL domain-containing protein (putative c-di-GMP-specific phosphodiesterase class I)